MHAATLLFWYPLAAVPPLAIHLHKHLASCYPLPSYPSFRPFRPPIILTLFLRVSSIKQPSSNILLTSLLLRKSTCLTTHLASSPSLRGISSCGRYCIRMSLLSWLVPSNSGGFHSFDCLLPPWPSNGNCSHADVPSSHWWMLCPSLKSTYFHCCWHYLTLLLHPFHPSATISISIGISGRHYPYGNIFWVVSAIYNFYHYDQLQ